MIAEEREKYTFHTQPLPDSGPGTANKELIHVAGSRAPLAGVEVLCLPVTGRKFHFTYSVL